MSSATRDGFQIICVVLNCGPMWNDSSSLLEHAFKNYTKTKVVEKDSTFKVIEVRNGKERFVGVKPVEDFAFALREDEKDDVELVAKDLEAAQAPFEKGDDAGRLEVYIDNTLIKTIRLEYSEGVESSSPFFYLKRILKDYISYTEQ